MPHNTMSHSVRRAPSAVVVVGLAAITGLVPFAIDMYLASLPDIGREFTAPTWATQLTLTGYLLLLGAGQLVAGPITDAVGRRRPLIVGLSLFVIGAVLAAVAPSMAWLVVARLVQAIGGALAAVVANSTVRDRSSGHAATQLFAVLMTVTAVAPIIAPAIGGWLDAVLGWRSVFWVLAGLGITTLIYALAFLKESHPTEARQPLALGTTMRGYAALLSSRGFALPWAAMISMFMLLFTYIGGASYVYQDNYGVSSEAFGLLFAVAGVALMVGASAATRLAKRLQQHVLALSGVSIAAIGSVITVVATLVGAPIGILVVGVSVIMLGLGVAEPALMSNSMSAVKENAGQAAALLGAGQFVLGAAASGIAGVVVAFGPAAWALMLLVIVTLALALSHVSARTRH